MKRPPRQAASRQESRWRARVPVIYHVAPARRLRATVRLFGTNGIREVVGEKFAPAFVTRVADSIGATLPTGSHVVVGWDGRTSSPAFARIVGSCGARRAQSDRGRDPAHARDPVQRPSPRGRPRGRCHRLPQPARVQRAEMHREGRARGVARIRGTHRSRVERGTPPRSITLASVRSRTIREALAGTWMDPGLVDVPG